MTYDRHIFREDNRSFVLAIDHTLTMPSTDLSDIRTVIEKAVDGGVDAFLAPYGCIRNFKGSFADAGLILRADGGQTSLDRSAPLNLLYTADDALRVGAHALLCMGFPGSKANPQTVVNVSELVRDAHSAGLSAGAEMLPYGFERPEGIDTRSVGAVSFACRMGADLGADFIKTEFVGGPLFSEVVRSCYAPVMVLGGSGAKDEAGLLDSVREAIAAGASGVIMGRNIVRSADITGLCRKIRNIIHNE